MKPDWILYRKDFMDERIAIRMVDAGMSEKMATTAAKLDWVNHWGELQDDKKNNTNEETK